MNKYTLHKISEGFIVTSDEQPLRDYKSLMLNTVVNKLFTDMGVSLMGDFKKVIAQQDQIDSSSLSEEEQKRIGWFDLDKFWKKPKLDEDSKSATAFIDGHFYGFEDGFKKAQELLSDRMFTLEDMNKAYNAGMKFIGEDKSSPTEFFQSISQKSWQVQLEEEIKLGYGANTGKIRPTLTKGKVKILKLL
jgi:hypothetical protein